MLRHSVDFKRLAMASSPDETNPIIRLTVTLQEYGYGKRGSKSIAARLGTGTPENKFNIDENQTYAELWMGDHPNGPSKSALTGVPLNDLIKASPETYLGKSVLSKFKDIQLPFLFKILSFEKALPLKSHPNRRLAEKLMKEERSMEGKNETFVDPNHKPEIAIVLSDKFVGFVGFRPVGEIQQFVKDVEELRGVLGKPTADRFLTSSEEEAQEQLKATFLKVFDGEEGKTKQSLLESFITRVEKEGNAAFGTRGAEEPYLSKVCQKLHRDYPGDIGIFVALFFTNLVVLKKGDGIAIQADVIHAYVEGDLIECMARSDNMIVHGFMASMDADPQSASMFASNLLPEPGPSSRLELQHEIWAPHSTFDRIELYEIPLEEFDILHLELPKGSVEEMKAGGIDGPSLWIVTEGTVIMEAMGDKGQTQAEKAFAGQVVFVKPNTVLKFLATEGEVQAWAACCEV